MTQFRHPAGFFRTELLSRQSTKYAEASIDDYAERTQQTVAGWKSMNGLQGGDPANPADALVQLAGQDEPPLRFAAGEIVVAAQHSAEGRGGTAGQAGTGGLALPLAAFSRRR